MAAPYDPPEKMPGEGSSCGTGPGRGCHCLEVAWRASGQHRHGRTTLLRLTADGQGDRSAVLAKVALERQITLIWVVAAVHRKRAGRVQIGGYWSRTVDQR